MTKPIIRIERGYAGHYLYKVQNWKDLPVTWFRWYWVLKVDIIFNALEDAG